MNHVLIEGGIIFLKSSCLGAKVKYSFIFFFPILLFSKEIYEDFIYSNFQGASQAQSFITFEVTSKNFVFFSSTITGVVKSFKVKGLYENGRVSNMGLFFPIDQIDTNNDSRNKSLWNLCLHKDQFHNLEIKLDSPYLIGEGVKKMKGILNVLGKKKPILINMNIDNKGKYLNVKGNSKISIRELEIPDPSTLVSKLNDKVDINFNFKIPFNDL